MNPRQLKILAVAGVEETSRADLLDVLRCRRAVAKALADQDCIVVPFDVRPLDMSDMSSLALRILEEGCDCIFNLFEGFGDDPSQEPRFARLLDELEMPYTGNGRKALESCLDKDTARRTLADAGLPVPGGFCVRSLDDRSLLADLTFPLFLKPNGEDGSVGIGADSLVRDGDELIAALKRRLSLFSKGIIVEEFLDGPEYNAAFLGNGPFEMLAFSRINYGDYPDATPFLGYDAKWDEESPSYAVMPEVAPALPGEKVAEIRSLCERAGGALGCRGYFRVDLREREGKLHVLEVNPNPDINTDSGFVRQAAHGGLDYPTLVKRLVKLALREGRENDIHDSPRAVQLPGHGRAERSLQRR